MSLRVWLPLTKNYDNYGLSDLSFADFSNIRHIRFIINATRGSNDAYTQLSRLEFLDESGNIFPYPSGTTVTTSMTGYHASEPPASIIDGNVNTKFCAPWSSGHFLTISLGSSQTVDINKYSRFQWYTANDGDWRDPVSFTLQFSSDGVNFVTGAIVTNASITTTRFALGYVGRCFSAGSGKISQSCYYNNSYNSGGLTSDKTINLGNQLSMCCWVKFNALTPDSGLGGSMGGQHRYPTNTGMGLTLKHVSSTTGYLSCNTGNGTSRTFNTYCGGTLLSANTWYHVAFTYDGSTIKFYVNGKLDGTHSYSGQVNVEDYVFVGAWSFESSSGPNTYGAYKLNGSINDFRVYDHVLSPKEVKEISKGLAAHYLLSGCGRTNYLKGAGKYTEKNPLVRNVTDSSVYNDSYVYYDLSDLSVTVPADGTYTWILESDGVPSNHATSGTNHTERRFSMWLQNTSTGNHYVWSGQATAPNGEKHGYMNIPAGTYKIRTNLYAANNTNYTVKMWNMRLVPGAYVENDPWRPNSEDAIYSALGFNDTKENDCSGYKNHATKIGNLVASGSGNSPLPRNSYVFSGSQALACGRNFMLTDSFTVACWAYSDNWANFQGCFISCTEGGGWGLGYQANTAGHGFEAYIGSKYYGIDMNYNGLSAGWHHIAATYNKSSLTGYIDGVQVANLNGVPATGVSYNANNGVFIGMESAGNATTPSGYGLVGQLSDMRIYGTALSAADIQELARRTVSVDNTGKNFCYSIQEKIGNSSVGKEGFVAAKGITEGKAPVYEGMKVKQLPDGSMWGRIHYLDITSDKTFFANAAEVGECVGKANRYSRMNDLKHYKDPDGNYELMLTYPQLNKTLPAGYTQLEYIEFTGAQLLRTGVYGYSSGGYVRGHRWELDMQFERNGIRQLMGYGPNGYEYWGMADSGLYEGMGVFAGERDKIVHDYTNGTTGGNTLWVKNGQRDVGANLDTSQEYCLFGLNWSGGPGYFCYGKLYRCKCIQANNTLIRDFIPAIRNSDGVVGLFDIVNNGFYASATATPFKAGNPTYSITPIDYIQSTGSQWINTRIAENQVHGLRLVFEVTGVQAAWQSILGGTLDTGFTIGTRDTDASGMYVRLRGDEIINTSGLLSGKNELLIWGGNISINGVFKAAYTAGQLSGGSGTMFIGNNNGSNRPSRIKIYEVEFFNSSGQTIKKFTPYMGNSGEGGLYDGVEEKFYSNAGSGNFTCGTRAGHKLLGPISLYNRWTQTSLTEDVNQGDNISFRQLETTWPQHSGPLKPANSSDTKYDCDVKGTGNWYAPVGQYKIWDAGIPAASSGAVQQTELWVRLDKLFGAPNNFSIAKNHITSTDFIEL